jgi:mono/diheme cytochrome c family protein
MRYVLMTVALAFAASVPVHAQAPNAAPAGNVENGKKLFSNHACFQCHGYVAQGGQAGARLTQRNLPWTYFEKYIRHPTGQMPPFTVKVLTDQEVADIYAWVKALPPPPPVDSIPALKGLK